MSEINSAIRENLIALRKSKHLTQQELSNKINYSDKTISRWELGTSVPDVETLVELSHFFDVDLEYFVTRHDENKIISNKVKSRNRILTTCLIDTFVFLIAVVAFIATFTSGDRVIIYPIFFYAIGIICLLNAFAADKYWSKKFIYAFGSGAIWFNLLAIYLTLIWKNVDYYNIWYLFVVGAPIQIALILIIKLRHPSDE